MRFDFFANDDELHGHCKCTRHFVSAMDSQTSPGKEDSTGNLSTGWPWPHFPRTDDPSSGIDQTTYDNLVRYTKYSSGAYQVLCPRPMGNTLVEQFVDLITSTQGFIARDDNRQELVVAFRGTKEIVSVLIDTSLMLTPLRGDGLPPLSCVSVSSGSSDEPRVHTGFLAAYQSVARTALECLRAQLDAHPSYRIVVAGHSLGGSIGSIASIAIKYTFAEKDVQLYTFGQPRTGDSAFAELVEDMVGIDNIFRAVHSVDGVPTMIPTKLGYRHHATEYWQFTEPRKFFYINVHVQ
ncbi:Alpha/Beta hydrolase protein, partial [Phlebopus sp. FC_14]